VVDPATGQGWKFKNRLKEFGAAWLGDIDRMIARNCDAAEIRRWLMSKYNGPIPIPDVKTFRSYVKHVKTTLNSKASSAVRVRKANEKTEQELRELLGRLQIAEADISDRKGLLERMVRFLLARTEAISQYQENLMDPRFEQIITNHLGLVKTTTDTLLKLEGQIGEHEFIARRIVEKFMVEMAPVLKQAAEDTYGAEKLKVFMERVNKGYAKIDFVRIKKEAADEAAKHEILEAVNALQTPGSVTR
jgi:hypothetical protein